MNAEFEKLLSLDTHIDEIRSMLLDLRNDIFYGKIKNKGNTILDAFNEIIWEIDVPLRNEIKSLNDER